MIRLIASDIDGTLLPYGQADMPQRLFPLIHRLREQGIFFCPASGRQYHSLRKLFAPVSDEICYLCENGAVLYGPGTESDAPLLSKTAMPRQEALSLAHAILDYPGSTPVIDGQNTNYLCGYDEAFIRRMRETHGNLVKIVERPEDVSEEIVKVAAFCPDGMESLQNALGPRWGQPFHMAVAGIGWLDFTLTNKGMGLTKLAEGLGVSTDSAAAFGDNWNDEAMLLSAGRAYLMERADPALRQTLAESRQSAGMEPPLLCGDVCDELEHILQQL